MYQRENLVGLDHAPKLGPHALKGGLDVVVPDNKIDLQIIKVGMIQGVFFIAPPKKLKYGKPRLGESTLT